MDVRDEILNRIDERQDEWLRLLSDLVRRPSENPPGDTSMPGDTWISTSLTHRCGRPRFHGRASRAVSGI